jgi:glycine cleavage system H lipoate-binding protein
MTLLIVAAMFLLLIAISMMRDKKPAVVSDVKPIASKSPWYLHPSHSFARIGADGLVEVGMDHFSRHALGAVQITELPKVGHKVRQGEKAWKAQLGQRAVLQRIPVDGEVVACNPDGDSWLLKIKASRLADNLANLMQGASVMQNRIKSARAQILLDYTDQLLPAMQDGGELVDGFARELSDEKWIEFCKEYFNCENC